MPNRMRKHASGVDPVGGLRGGRRGRVLVSLAVGWFVLIGIRLTIPALLPFITREFAISLTTAGLLVTVLYGVYSLGQFPGGLIGDKLGERAVLAAGAGVATVAVALLAVPAGFTAFVLGVVLFAVGSALFAPTRLTVLSDLFPRRDGTAIGITLAAGNAGNMLLPAAAGIVAATFTWRHGFGLAVPILALITAGLWATVPATTSKRLSETALSVDFLRRIGGTIGSRRVFAITTLLLVIEFIWSAVSGIYPTYLVVAKGVPESTAAVLFGLFFGWGIVVNLLAGAIGDRVGARRSLAVLLPITIGAFVAVTLVDDVLSLVLVTMAMSSLLGCAPIIFPALNAELPAEVRGSGLGLIRSGYMTLGASGPVVMGALGDASVFDVGFYLLAGITAVALALTAVLPEPRQQRSR